MSNYSPWIPPDGDDPADKPGYEDEPTLDLDLDIDEKDVYGKLPAVTQLRRDAEFEEEEEQRPESPPTPILRSPRGDDISVVTEDSPRIAATPAPVAPTAPTPAERGAARRERYRTAQTEYRAARDNIANFRPQWPLWTSAARREARDVELLSWAIAGPQSRAHEAFRGPVTQDLLGLDITGRRWHPENYAESAYYAINEQPGAAVMDRLFRAEYTVFFGDRSGRKYLLAPSDVQTRLAQRPAHNTGTTIRNILSLLFTPVMTRGNLAFWVRFPARASGQQVAYTPFQGEEVLLTMYIPRAFLQLVLTPEQRETFNTTRKANNKIGYTDVLDKNCYIRTFRVHADSFMRHRTRATGWCTLCMDGAT